MARRVRWMMALAVAGICATAPAAQAQSVNDVLRSITRPSTTVSQQEASDGLRAALDQSAKAVTNRLGRPDGFFGDTKIRIPLPGALARAQRTLKPLGLAAPLDELQLTINRSAEAAMPTAQRLFVDAIKSITFEDALQILRGGDDAATRFLRARTEKNLVQLLTPPMEQALTRTGAYTALEGVGRRTGVGNLAAVSRTDLTNFAVQRTLDGAFGYIAEEERGIRRDPAKRGTDLLRKVFGAR